MAERRINISISLYEETIDHVDAIRGMIPRSRFIEESINKALEVTT